MRTQRRRSQPSENAAFAIDGDDRDKREDGAGDYQQDAQDREIDRHRARRIRRRSSQARAEQPAQPDIHQDRQADRSDNAERLAQEDLDFEPGQFPKSAQHGVSLLSLLSVSNLMAGELQKYVLECRKLGAEVDDTDPVLAEAVDHVRRSEEHTSELQSLR